MDLTNMLGSHKCSLQQQQITEFETIGTKNFSTVYIVIYELIT